MSRGVSPFQEWISSEPWKRSKSVGLTGLKGSSKAFFLSLWREKGAGPLLIVVPTLQRAESLAEDLQFFGVGTNEVPLLFPPWETLPYDEIPPHPEIIRERVRCLFFPHGRGGKGHHFPHPSLDAEGSLSRRFEEIDFFPAGG